jgi:hypothetical protein
MSINTKNIDLITVHSKFAFGIDFIVVIVMEKTPIGMVD